MSDPLIIAASGLQVAALRMQSVGSNVANAHGPDHQPTQVRETARADGTVSGQLVPAARTDLATQLVSQQETSTAYRANMAVFGAVGRAYQSLIDIIA
jgi:flagellar basal body rod protein FlgC